MVTPASRDYDAVIAAQRLSDVYDSTKGWPLQAHSPDELTRDPIDLISTALLGRHGAGKTFVLRKLSGRLDSFAKQTPSVGLVLASSSPSDTASMMAWLDTPGRDSPAIQCTPQGAYEGQVQGENDVSSVDFTARLRAVQSQMREASRMDEFHHQLALAFGDAIIFVINELNERDRLSLLELRQRAHDEKKLVIVVHNLHRIHNVRELDKYMSLVENELQLKRLNVNVELEIDDAKALVVPGYVPVGTVKTKAFEVTKLHSSTIDGSNTNGALLPQHVFLVDDTSDRTHNTAVCAHVRKLILQSQPRRCSVKRHLEASLKSALLPVEGGHTDAAQLSLTEEVGEFGRWMIRLRGDQRPELVRLGPTQPSLWVSSGGDGQVSTPHNLVKLVPKSGQAVAPSRSPVHYALQIAVPGLSVATVDDLRKRLVWGSDALLLRDKTWVVVQFSVKESAHDLHARTQEALMRDEDAAIAVVESTADHVASEAHARPMLPSMATRAVSVLVKVQIDRISTHVAPAVTYNDGVLSILFATK